MLCLPNHCVYNLLTFTRFSEFHPCVSGAIKSPLFLYLSLLLTASCSVLSNNLFTGQLPGRALFNLTNLQAM